MMENGSDNIGTSAGSYYYSSPEACLGVTYQGRKSDIWACGVTLYYMIYKRHPFEESLIPNLFKKIQTEEPSFRPQRSSQMTFEVDPLLKDLVRKLLIKNPEDRITVDEIKKHSWITMNGREPMPDLQREDISATEEELQKAYGTVKQLGKVILKRLETDAATNK